MPFDSLHALMPEESLFDSSHDVLLDLGGFDTNPYVNATLENGAADATNYSRPLPNTLATSARSDGKRPASSEIACSRSKTARRQSQEALLSESSYQLKQTSIRYDGRELSDLISRASLLARLLWKYSPSYVADVLSLRGRFSRTCSWKSRTSSKVSSVVFQDATANMPVAFNLQSCWCHTPSCLHKQLATVVRSYLLDTLIPPQLSGIDVIAMDPFKNGPLHIAAQTGAPFPVFEALIEAGADIHAVNAKGETFLHIFDPTCALREPWWLRNLFLLLEQRDFEFNARDHGGRSILLSLLRHRGFHENPTLLSTFTTYLTTNEDLWLSSLYRDRTGLNAHTHLWKMITHAKKKDTTQYACYHMMDEAYRPLLDFANPELLSTAAFATRRSLKSPLEVFDRYIVWNKPNTLHELAEYFSWSGSQEAFSAFQEGIDQLLEAGFDINAYDDEGYTPLMIVIMQDRANETGEGTTILVEHLISKGASIHRIDRQGMSLLHIAAKRGLMATTELLIEKGAKVNAVTDNGQSVLKIAYHELKRASKDALLYARIMLCITVLIDRGAFFNPTVEQIWT
jgi:ankyrin repeat protein